MSVDLLTAPPVSRGLEVRQATLSDWPALRSFIRATYGGEAPYKDWPRHRWQFLENPHQPALDGRLPIWVAADGDVVAGAIAVQAGTVQVEGQTLPAGWIVDVMVRPEYRGRGIGHRIHERIAASVPVLVTLTMAEATRRMAERAGCVTLGEVRGYSKLVKPTSDDVRRFLINRTRHRSRINRLTRWGCRAGAHRVMGAALSARRPAQVEPPDGIEIAEVEAFDVEVDQLWETVRGQYRAIFVRDTGHLNWRFGNPPDLDYRRFLARRSGQVAGYVVLRRSLPSELRSGVIADVFADPDDQATWDALIGHAVDFFGDTVAAIDAGASLPALDEALRRFGFRVTRRHAPTVVAADPGVRAAAAAADWFFTRGDHDWDQVHVAWT